MKASLNSFIVDKSTGIHLHPGNNADFGYSDGQEEEERIFSILKKTSDHGMFSEELGTYMTDWPTEYHFSPVRHNLLRHFDFNPTQKILELGCGCGAITRQIGESGAQTTSVEGSFRRAQCARERSKDLDNVKVYCSNFQDISFENEYDYVTLIGVLEYSGIFFSGDNPFEQCLAIAKSALKKGGKLIIAIENRLGLKYFNGLIEDHVGLPYFGLYDLYNRETATTFGKQEMSSLLNTSGFNSLKFQYPFPDYKLPTLLVNEEAFENDDFDVVELLRPLRARDYGSTFGGNFQEGMVWAALNYNGLIQDFSNSFLITASLEDQGKQIQPLAIKYSTNRRVQYMTRTQFSADSDLNLIVEKSLLKQESQMREGKMKFNFVPEPYEHGHTLEYFINSAIKSRNVNLLKNHLALWLRFLTKESIQTVNTASIYDSISKPEYIDCLPSNLIVQKEELKYIDKEWSYSNEFTIKFLFYKFWKNVLESETGFFRSLYGSKRNYLTLFAAEFQIFFSKTDLLNCKNIYNDISSIVSDETFENESTRSYVLSSVKKVVRELMPPILIKLIRR